MLWYTILTFSDPTWQIRPAEDTSDDKAEATDNDSVELEKSNILLMGPTGSGNLVNYTKYFLNYFNFHMVVAFEV